MLAALRSLCFANLSECHEMILRSLDEITKYHLDCLEDFRNVGLEVEFEPTFLKTSGSVGIMRDAIAMLSNELYRKQCWLKKLGVGTIVMVVPKATLEFAGSGKIWVARMLYKSWMTRHFYPLSCGLLKSYCQWLLAPLLQILRLMLMSPRQVTRFLAF